MRLVLLLFAASQAWGAAFTASVTGAWNNSATWGGAGIPASGDTATINAGVTVTIPVGYTAVVGTSPTSDAGTVALTINGPLIVNGTLQWKGPVRQGNATVTVNAGATITYDSTGAATPSTALYSWQISTASSQANAKLVLSGTSGSHVTVNSASNNQTGGFGNTGSSWADGGRIEATYTDFSYQGATGASGTFAHARLASAVNFTFDSCTIDHSGQILIDVALSGTSTFRINQTAITNPANTSFAVQISVAPSTLTSGTRAITNSVIYGRTFVLGTGGIDTGFTLKNNVFRMASYSVGNNLMEFSSGSTVPSWDQNLLLWNSTIDGASIVPLGTLTNTYMFRMGNPSMSNMHPINFYWIGATSNVFDKWIFDYTSADQNSDMFEPNGADSATSRTTTVKNSIFLPNGGGASIGSFFNNSSGQAMSHTKLTWDNNTMYAPSLTGQVFGIGCEAAGSTMPVGSVASARSNLLYRSTNGQGLLFSNSTGTCTPADGAITAADYNGLFNINTSIYTTGSGMTSAKFGSTPGTHDVTADPVFVDGTRNLLAFDTGYLGNAVGTAWATSTTYSVGNIVSASTGSFYGGATYNYVCITAHTSDATTKPGSGSGWAQYWEPASVKRLQDSVLAGTTYSGGANSLIGELVAWVRAGFKPTDTGAAALATAGFNGTWIGAVEPVAFGVVPSVISFTCTSGGSVPGSYSITAKATGGGVLDNWSASKTQTWLSLSPTSGSAAGTFSASLDCSGLAPGNYSDTITVSSTTVGIPGSPRTVAVSVTAIAGPAVSTLTLPNGAAATAYSQTLAAVGGVAPYTWSITSGTLCPGLSLNAGTGAITGTPLIPVSCSFTVQVTDTNLASGSQALTLTISDVPRSTLSGSITLRGTAIR